LAEEVARPDGGDDRLLTGLRRQTDLDRAGHDDEEGVTRVALVEDDLAAAEAPRAEAALQAIDRGAIETPEEADPRQRRGGGGVGHPPMLPALPKSAARVGSATGERAPP